MKVAQKAAKSIKSKARNRVKSAQVKAAQVRKTLDEVLIENDHLKKVRQQLLQKKKLIEKESELATQLALQVLDRAKQMRLKLERKSRRKGAVPVKKDIQAVEEPSVGE